MGVRSRELAKARRSWVGRRRVRRRLGRAGRRGREKRKEWYGVAGASFKVVWRTRYPGKLCVR